MLLNLFLLWLREFSTAESKGQSADFGTDNTPVSRLTLSVHTQPERETSARGEKGCQTRGSPEEQTPLPTTAEFQGETSKFPRRARINRRGCPFFPSSLGCHDLTPRYKTYRRDEIV